MPDPNVPAEQPNSGEDDHGYAYDPATHAFDGTGTLADDGVHTGTAATYDPEPTTRAAKPSLSAHQNLGRYTVLELLGSGGMGEVWRVWDPSLRREVALKIMTRGRSQPSRRLARFVAEAQATAQLQHPGVVPVYDHGQLPDGRPYYTMKVIEGRTLAEIVPGLQAKSTPEHWGQTADGLTIIDLVSALHDVSEALAYAHERGVIHRDIKPANILIGHYGEVLLVDWGLVKILGESTEPTDAGPVQTDQSLQPDLATRFGAVAGTVGFMPPEQANGQTDRIGPASDVYALGAALWYVLTGLIPRKLDTLAARLHALPRVDGALRDICLRAMATDPDDRPQSAGRWSEQLGRWLRGARAQAQAAASAQRAELAILALPLEQQRQVRIWCLRIVDPEGRVSSLPVHESQRASVQPLLDTGLFKQEQGGLTFADPTLPDTWSRLKTWMIDHAEQHLQLHALASATRDWMRAQRSDRLLWTDPDVVHRGRAISELQAPPERAFIAACTANLARRRRKQRSLVALIMATLLGSTALSVVQWRDAVDARNDEARARIEAEARSFIQQAHRNLAEQDPHAAVAYFQAAETLPTETAHRAAAHTAAALNPVRIYSGHRNETKAAAWAPDGRLVATGSLDSTVQIWSPRTGETLHALVHDSGIRKVVWSPDGRYIATCTLEGSVRIWEVSSGDLLHRLPDDNPWVSPLRFLRDGRLLSSDRKGVVKIYNPKSGEATQTLHGHEHYVFASDATPDGRWLATASVDETVRIWDLVDGTLHRTFKHPMQLLYVTITPDGRRVAAGGTDDSRVWLWDIESDEQVAVLESKAGIITVVDASPDSQTIVTMGKEHAVHLWSAETGAHLRRSQRFDGDEVTGGGFSPDGSLVGASTPVEGVVYIDPKTGSILERETRSGASVRSFQWSPSGDAVLLGHPNGEASIHTLATKPTQETQPCGSGGLVEARFAPDNRWLALALARGGLCVSALDTGETVTIFDDTVGHVLWGPTSRRLSFWRSSSNNPLVRVWDRITGSEGIYLQGEPTSSEAQISPDGKRLYSASRNNSLMSVSLQTGQTLDRIPLPARPLTTHFEGDRVMVLYHDRTADIWDVAQRKRLARHDRTDLNTATRALDPNGRFVVWESRSGILEKIHFDDEEEWQVEIPSEPLSIEMSRSGRWVVVLDSEQTARVYSTRTGMLVFTVVFEGLAPSIDFSSSGDRMLLLTDHGEVRVYRLRDGAVLSVLQLERGAEIRFAHFPTDRTVVTVSKDHVARTWEIPDEPPAPGAISNLRPCRNGQLVPVRPWPSADSVWAPDDQCALDATAALKGTEDPRQARSAVD